MFDTSAPTRPAAAEGEGDIVVVSSVVYGRYQPCHTPLLLLLGLLITRCIEFVIHVYTHTSNFGFFKASARTNKIKKLMCYRSYSYVVTSTLLQSVIADYITYVTYGITVLLQIWLHFLVVKWKNRSFFYFLVIVKLLAYFGTNFWEKWLTALVHYAPSIHKDLCALWGPGQKRNKIHPWIPF